MSCYHPIQAWRSKHKADSGKRPLVFNAKEGLASTELKIPCGRCIGCRLEHSRQWALRCVDESRMHRNNCFVTLTYDECHVPESGSLNKEDITLFFKRMRKALGNNSFRYYQAGEYGDAGSRPHHHVCFFGYYPHDAVYYYSFRRNKYYTSDFLTEKWGKGFAMVTDFSFETAAYVSRYCTKKQTGKLADMWYDGLLPEYATMSRRPAIGKNYWEKYKHDIITTDTVIVRDGLKCKPSKYYDRLYDLENPQKFKGVKYARRIAALKAADDNTYDRLAVKEEIKLIKFKQLQRSFENGNTQGVFDS